MLIHTIIRKEDIGKDRPRRKTISQFAWKRYEKTGLWEIEGTMGKPTAAVKAPAPPPTSFKAPPQVVELKPKAAAVERPSDPIGLDAPEDVKEWAKIADAPVWQDVPDPEPMEKAKPKRGRPPKKTTA